MATNQRERVWTIWGGVSLALVGCLVGLIGAAGAAQPWSALGWATFVAGWVVAAVATVRAGFHFGRRR